jgi:peptidoglycan/xylan/chitin deacetylase (PgdA/CDA1 family)
MIGLSVYQRLARVTSALPAARRIKRRLQQNVTACGLTYWAMTLGHEPGFRVLTYHRILEQPDPLYKLAVTRRAFERHLQLLTRFCTVWSLDRIMDALDAGRPLPRHCVALTFDDGYRDTATVAWPLLKRYGLSATWFVAVGAIEQGILWPDTLRYAVHHSRLSEVELECFADGPRTFPLDTPADRALLVRRVQGRLKSLPNAERERVLRRVVRRLLGLPMEALRPQGLMASWEDVARVAAEGMAIGAHTLTHPVLSRVPVAEASVEIAASRRRLQRRLRVSVDHFAYPFGERADVTPQIQRIVRAAGFRSACMTTVGVNAPAQDRFALTRIDASRTSPRMLVRAMTEEAGR